MSRFSGLVLAGGSSRRMGQDKAFLKWEGQTMLARQLDVLEQSGASEILISGRRDQDFALHPYPIVFDSVENAGPLAGLIAGWEKASHDWLMVLAVDLPRMTAQFIQWLADQRDLDKRVGVVPTTQGHFEPLAAMYHRKIVPLFRQSLERGDYKLQHVLAQAVEGGLLRSVPLSEQQLSLLKNVNRLSEI